MSQKTTKRNHTKMLLAGVFSMLALTGLKGVDAAEVDPAERAQAGVQIATFSPIVSLGRSGVANVDLTDPNVDHVLRTMTVDSSGMTGRYAITPMTVDFVHNIVGRMGPGLSADKITKKEIGNLLICMAAVFNLDNHSSVTTKGVNQVLKENPNVLVLNNGQGKSAIAIENRGQILEIEISKLKSNYESIKISVKQKHLEEGAKRLMNQAKSLGVNHLLKRSNDFKQKYLEALQNHAGSKKIDSIASALCGFYDASDAYKKTFFANCISMFNDAIHYQGVRSLIYENQVKELKELEAKIATANNPDEISNLHKEYLYKSDEHLKQRQLLVKLDEVFNSYVGHGGGAFSDALREVDPIFQDEIGNLSRQLGISIQISNAMQEEIGKQSNRFLNSLRVKKQERIKEKFCDARGNINESFNTLFVNAISSLSKIGMKFSTPDALLSFLCDDNNIRSSLRSSPVTFFFSGQVVANFISTLSEDQRKNIKVIEQNSGHPFGLNTSNSCEVRFGRGFISIQQDSKDLICMDTSNTGEIEQFMSHLVTTIKAELRKIPGLAPYVFDF